MTKKCYRCKLIKQITEFSKDKYNKDGYTYDCKKCRGKIHKKWYDNNPETVKRIITEGRDYRRKYYNDPQTKKHYMFKRLFREFGITEEKYNQILKSQNNVCAICNESENEVSTRNKNLSVDHCHNTGKVRGLLCSNCNRAIGLLGDNPVIIQNALKYINK